MFGCLVLLVGWSLCVQTISFVNSILELTLHPALSIYQLVGLLFNFFGVFEPFELTTPSQMLK